MRNFFPNPGNENNTVPVWGGNTLFGSFLPADVTFSPEAVHSGSHAVRVAWPEPDGSGKAGMALAQYNHEGILGEWRLGTWLYVPSGCPDVSFGSTWEGHRQIVVTTKDEWVFVETALGKPTQIGNMTNVSLETEGAAPAYLENIVANPRFENGLTNWSYTAGVTTSGVTLNGHKTIALTRSAGSVVVAAIDYSQRSIAPGEVLSGSIRAKLDATVGDLTLHIQYLDSVGAITGYSDATVFAGNGQETVMKIENSVVPANTVNARLRFHIDSGGDGTVWVTDTLMVKSPVAPEYFDGDTQGMFDTAWTGTPHASPSTRNHVVFMDDFYAYPGATGADSSEPDVAVSISWDGGIKEEAPVWDDVTEFVQGFDPAFGRSSEIGSIEAGTVSSLVLDNADGRFTPKKTRWRENDIPENRIGDPNVVDVAENWWRWHPNNGYIMESVQEIDSAHGASCGLVGIHDTGAGGLYIMPLNTVAQSQGLSNLHYPITPTQSVSARFVVKAIQPVTLMISLQKRDSTGAYFGAVNGETVTLAAGEEYVFEMLNISGFTNGGYLPILSFVGTLPPDGPAIYFGNVAAYVHDDPSSVTWESTPFAHDGQAYWSGVRGSVHPYYPNVKPRRPIQIRATWDGADWPLFRGYIERFPASTAAGQTEVTVPCVDAFGMLANQNLENLYLNYLRELTPREIYPLNDGPDSMAGLLNPSNRARVITPSGSNVAEGLLSGSPNVEAGASDLFPNGTGLGSLQVSGIQRADDAPSLATTYTARAVEFPATPLDTTASSPGWTISFWHAYDGQPAASEGAAEDIGSALALRIEDAITGSLFASIVLNAHPSGSGYTVYWPNGEGGFDLHWSSAADGETNYKSTGNNLVLIFSNDCREDGSNIPGLGIYVNGSGGFKELPGNVFLGRKGSYRMLVGSNRTTNPSENFGSSSLMSHNFRVEAFSIHDTALSPFWNILSMQAYAAGIPDEAVSERVNRFLNQLAWPDALRNIDKRGDSSLIRFVNWDSESPKALDQLRALALDTNGLLFVNAAGQVTYQSRRLRQNPVAEVVFDHDAGTGVESPLEFEMSEQDIINVVNVDNAYGVKATIRNEDSVAEFDARETSKSVRLSSDEEALQFGYWLVNRFGDARLRVDSVVINPSAHASGGLWGHVLTLGLSTVVGLRGLPDTAPDANLNYFVEAIAHTVVRDGDRLTWLTSLQVSPASGRSAWMLGDPVYGVLGQTTVLQY